MSQIVYPQAFLKSVDLTLAFEGGYQCDFSDSGNWTGGSVGKGLLVGTKFGISAAAYPTLDIQNLTEDDAVAIYFKDYWSAPRIGELPAQIAQVTFDASVNSGPEMGVKWTQKALGVMADGVIGPITLSAANEDTNPKSVAIEAISNRLVFVTGLRIWNRDSKGFARRIVTLSASI